VPILPPPPQAPNTYRALDLIADSLIEIGAISPGEVANIDPDLAQWALRKANYVLDVWAAKRQYVYASTFLSFNLVAGLSPHTIGPNNATFAVNQRPNRIESWALVLNTGPTAVDLPRRPTRDKDWWAAQQVKTLETNIPTDMYYEPDNPNGSCFFWPVPNTVYPVRLELWTLLAQFAAITDPVDGPGGSGFLPPAYRTALMLTLAETLQPGAGKEDRPGLAAQAAAARAAVFGNNSKSPRMATADSGMSTGKRRADFNWETGSIT
jgi:hypothetical protein